VVGAGFRTGKERALPLCKALGTRLEAAARGFFGRILKAIVGSVVRFVQNFGSDMALARRNVQAALDEPEYEMADVPKCERDLSTSVVIRVDDRSVWFQMLGELLLVCNEAALRFEKRCGEEIQRIKSRASRPLDLSVLSSIERNNQKGNQNGLHEPIEKVDAAISHLSHTVKKTMQILNGNVTREDVNIPYQLIPIHTGKPLSLEYMADRLDLDDPLHGYVVRTSKEAWLQGFITISTFTTWQRWFRWDSLMDEAGVLMFEEEGAGLDALAAMGLQKIEPEKPASQWWMDRLVDGDGTLAAALNAEIRDGDPDGEGIIWPHVAELSLLGGLGCGAALVQLIIEELESEDSPYHYIVLQATENSVPFYESQGFVRVGAVARYFEKPEVFLNSHSRSVGTEPLHTPTRTVTHHPDPRDMFATGGEKAPDSEDDRKSSTSNSRRKRRRLSLTNHGNNLPTVKGSCSRFRWHCVSISEADETVWQLAEKLKIRADDLLFMNRRLYESLNEDSKLKEGMALRIPEFPKFVDPLDFKAPEFTPIKQSETKPMVHMDATEGKVSTNGLWYRALDDETPRAIATKLKLDTNALIQCNMKYLPGLNYQANLIEDTIVRLPCRAKSLKEGLDPEIEEMQQDWGCGHDDGNREGLTDIMAYRHWSFSDDPAEVSVASYMMARPLEKRRKGGNREHEKNEKIEELLQNTRKRLGEENSIPKKWVYGMEPTPPTPRKRVEEKKEEKETEKKEKGEEEKSDGLFEKKQETEVSFADDKSPDEYTMKAPFEACGDIEMADENHIQTSETKISVRIRCQLPKQSNQYLGLKGGPLVAIEPGFKPGVIPEEVAAAAKQEGVSPRRQTTRRRKANPRYNMDGTVMIGPIFNPITRMSQVFIRNSPYVGPPLQAVLHRPLSYSLAGDCPPEKPRNPLSPFMIFCERIRPAIEKERPDHDAAAILQELTYRWKSLGEIGMKRFQTLGDLEKRRYEKAIERYEEEIRIFSKMQEPVSELLLERPSSASLALYPGIPLEQRKLFVNQVVKLRPKRTDTARAEFLRGADPKAQSEHIGVWDRCRTRTENLAAQDPYFFVLTYIPDLFWARIAPLKRQGVFPESKRYSKQHAGRPKWVLVPEQEAQELDVSASRCSMVKSFAVKKTADADKEEWDLII